VTHTHNSHGRVSECPILTDVTTTEAKANGKANAMTFEAWATTPKKKKISHRH